ncbi:MAG: hypothetical protein DMG86_21670 [Acidobacteria bacterium]|nr:MAG: hypothetical protein DMG86_21670 [Acidobacteriota bacterium]
MQGQPRHVGIRFVVKQIIPEAALRFCGIAEQLTFLSVPPTIASQWPLRPNPWGKQFPITAYSAGLAAAAWAWFMRLRT